MNGAGVVAASALAGTVLAVFGLAAVHHHLLPIDALAIGALAALAASLLRGAWDHLPQYVGFWLDLGVVVATTLLVVTGHGLATGVAFTVLRAPELLLLGSAALLVAVATTGLAYTHLRLSREVADREQRMAELERTALQSRLGALSAQIRPHFLFNTLNTLAELVHEDEDAAEDLVTDLAAMMRTALRSATGLVTLADELDGVHRLLRIEASRLGDRLRYTVDPVPDVPVRLPALSIQPLVENAVKYAVASRTEGGAVTVTVTTTDTSVHVCITDDGPGLPEDVARALATGVRSTTPRGTEGHGGGLWNCRERLRLAWPDSTASLRHLPEHPGTTLLVELPLSSQDPP